MRRRVRFARRQIERISRTATLGGLFLSFLKIGVVGFGGGVAVLAQIRLLTVRKRLELSNAKGPNHLRMRLKIGFGWDREIHWSTSPRLVVFIEQVEGKPHRKPT